MTQQPRPIDVESFFRAARDAELISPEVAEVLTAEVAASGADPAEYVLEQGLMDAVAVDIVRTLQRPSDVVTGYEVEGLIGRGGLGVVYRARQTALDRPVALKTILVSQMTQPDSVARFEREAKLVGRLRHPNIVVAYDFGRQHGRVFLVMELVDGEDLQSYIELHGMVDESTTWSVVRQAAAGLAHAAQSNVVHRDIKPSNMLLVAAPAGATLSGGEPMVKIADFGLARICDASPSDPRITTDGCTLGSPQYMAPEQIIGSNVDLRADIYSLGATAYHLLTGATPYAGLSLGEILARKTTQEMPHLDAGRFGLSPQSARLVADMTVADPDQRIGDYDQLLERIDRLPKLRTSSPLDGPGRPGQRADTATVALADTMPIMPSAPAGDAAEAPRANAVYSAGGTVGLAPRRRRRQGLWAASIILLVSLIPLAFILLGGDQGIDAGADGPRYILSGRGAALFDGRRISDWRTTSGAWFAANDAEGGRVLSGRGTVRRRLPGLAPVDDVATAPPRNYQLNVAFDLQTATAVELHFGITPADQGRSPRYVLRATADEVMLARRADDRAPLEPITPVALPPRNPDPAAPDYHLLRVERHGTFWRAYVDARPLGGLPVAATPELPEFRLLTEGGPALFDALHVSELVPAP